MSVVELNEDSIKEFIKSGTVIIKGWMDNCSYCDDFKPVFEEFASKSQASCGSINIPVSGASEFRRTWMKSKPGEPSGAPAIFVFENGELKRKHHGKLSLKELESFVKDGTVPQKRIPTFEEFIDSANLDQLKIAIFDHNRDKEMIMRRLEVLNNKFEYLLNKQQPQKAA